MKPPATAPAERRHHAPWPKPFLWQMIGIPGLYRPFEQRPQGFDEVRIAGRHLGG
ncbi:MAG: hypothetical protein WBH51_04425 [Mycolicibacter algericus]|uniref:hypothetical protein n=1 Tax=Mycobacteriaceae TaxID=1762 RepID=UPI0018762992|nr:hypothetical protein [Mycobacterium novum]